MLCGYAVADRQQRYKIGDGPTSLLNTRRRSGPVFVNFKGQSKLPPFVLKAPRLVDVPAQELQRRARDAARQQRRAQRQIGESDDEAAMEDAPGIAAQQNGAGGAAPAADAAQASDEVDDTAPPLDDADIEDGVDGALWIALPEEGRHPHLP